MSYKRTRKSTNSSSRRKLRKGNTTKVKAVKIRLRSANGRFAPQFSMTERKRGVGRRKSGLTTGTRSKRIKGQRVDFMVARSGIARKVPRTQQGNTIQGVSRKRPVFIDNRRISNSTSSTINNLKLSAQISLGAGAFGLGAYGLSKAQGRGKK